jgi:predicted GIY-YIG superfamily endonuclease
MVIKILKIAGRGLIIASTIVLILVIYRVLLVVIRGLEHVIESLPSFLTLIFLVGVMFYASKVVTKFGRQYWEEKANGIEGYVQSYGKVTLTHLKMALNFSNELAVERMIAEINKNRNTNLMIDPKTNEVFFVESGAKKT